MSQLRQREGEVGQLRREVARLNEKHERLLAELSEQSAKAESRLSLLSLEVDVEGKSLSQRYEVLLQLYGQKLEENNELKLDLREAKEAYQSQGLNTRDYLFIQINIVDGFVKQTGLKAVKKRVKAAIEQPIKEEESF
ncbi:hypothetical protein ACTXT7_003926 [Hymenolepis weldensis]